MDKLILINELQINLQIIYFLVTTIEIKNYSVNNPQAINKGIINIFNELPIIFEANKNRGNNLQMTGEVNKNIRQNPRSISGPNKNLGNNSKIIFGNNDNKENGPKEFCKSNYNLKNILTKFNSIINIERIGLKNNSNNIYLKIIYFKLFSIK